MSEREEYPLRDTAIYNPHLLSKEELIGLFSARQRLLEKFLEELGRSRPGQAPQHHLLIAQRGMGKTMLLRRLHFAIEDDPELAAVWLPLDFPEEQYNVGGLSDLWLNCLDALGDALERLGRKAEAERLDSQLEALLDHEEEKRARETLALLLKTAAELERRLVLLVDNIDLILERTQEQGWALREILSEQPAILLVGASSRALEASYKYDQPFYDFFQIHELGGLSLQETSALLRHYAERWRNDEVLRIVQEEPGRIRTLHTLTGGNPRTVALLFNILRRGLDGDVRTDLENLLDHCTPLYKARLEELAPQRQRVVHTLAVHWHPASAAQVADELRLDVSAVSSQLTRLVRDGIVETVPFEPASKTGFQLAERFFNIWYLMRATRRARRRLIWLVEFLKMCYGQEKLHSHALEHLSREYPQPPQERLRFVEYSFALAGAVAEVPIRRALETSGLYTLMEDKSLRGRLPELLDLEGEDSELRGRVEHKERLEHLRDEFSTHPTVGNLSAEELWDSLAHSIQRIEKKESLAGGFSAANAERLGEILEDFEKEADFIAELVGSERVARALREAYAKGWMMTTHDLEGARVAAIRLSEPQLEVFSLARSLDTTSDPRPLLEELEPHLEKTDLTVVLALWAKHIAHLDPESTRLHAVLEAFQPREIGSPLVLLDLAVAWLRIDRPEEAAECVDRTRELGIDKVPRTWLNDVALAWEWLGTELDDRGHHQDAEKALGEVIETHHTAAKASPEDASTRVRLGAALGRQGRYSEAEEAYRKAVELSPESVLAWRNLGASLFSQERFEEAEEAYRKKLELSPEDADAWMDLGLALGRQGRHSEAEEAYRKAVELLPKSVPAWRNLGDSLFYQGRFEEAEETYRKGLELSPEDADTWVALAISLGRQVRHSEAEEACRKAVELSPESVFAWWDLGASLFSQERFEEAEEAYRKRLELSPEDADAWMDLGITLDRQGRYSEAEEASRKAVKLSPESVPAWRNLGASLFFQERFEKASEAYRKSLELSPEDADAWSDFGLALGRQGRHSEAEEACRKALGLDPANGSTASSLAWILYGQNLRLAEAEDLAREAVNAEPESPVFTHTLASILARNGKWAEAFAQAEIFIAVGSERFRERNWPDILQFFREAVSAGKARESADLLDRLGLADRWQPLREALETTALGRRSYLRRLAPEIRQPTEEILEQLEAKETSP